MQTQDQNKSGIMVTKSERRYDIDWLRVLAVLLLFFFHPAMIFFLWRG